MTLSSGHSKGTPPNRKLATLIHISDSHFSARFIADANWLRRWFAEIPGVQATFGHSYPVARSLAIRVNQFIVARRAQQIPVCVVFTGDLSRRGDRAELATGATFFRSAHFTGATDPVGLNLKPTRSRKHRNRAGTLFSVPGNHDIWQRRHPDRLDDFRQHFPDTFPAVAEIKTPGRPIVLWGLDSTQNTQLRHRLALGRLSERQLESLRLGLKATVAAFDSQPIQIVCLHHPLTDPPETQFSHTMRLDNREAVARALREAGVDLVLAGHVHESFFTDATHNAPAQAIAGTACQQCSPAGWSFLVLDVFDQEIVAHVLEYDRERLAFCEGSASPKVFSLRRPDSGPAQLPTGDVTARQRFGSLEFD